MTAQFIFFQHVTCYSLACKAFGQKVLARGTVEPGNVLAVTVFEYLRDV